MLHLRPHHAMCILNYRGKGYSEEFVKNMNSIVAALDDDVLVTLEKRADGVCAACQNRIDVSSSNPVGCKFMDKVARYDAGLMDLLSLNDGDVLSWGELKKRVRNEVFPDKLASICGDCEWFYICRNACNED